MNTSIYLVIDSAFILDRLLIKNVFPTFRLSTYFPCNIDFLGTDRLFSGKKNHLSHNSR